MIIRQVDETANVATKREEILDMARKCVCGERDRQYGSPENNFTVIADFWRNYISAAHGLTVNITAEDVAIMMALLKVARIATSNLEDSFVDLAGYAACAWEVASK